MPVESSFHPTRCNGCGACVTACRSGALRARGVRPCGAGGGRGCARSSGGQSSSVTGVAIVCREAPTAPRVGGAWLSLPVPSISMVSAGWLLQLRCAGADVRVLACEDERLPGACSRPRALRRTDVGRVLGFSLA